MLIKVRDSAMRRNRKNATRLQYDVFFRGFGLLFTQPKPDGSFGGTDICRLTFLGDLDEAFIGKLCGNSPNIRHVIAP